jgi:hypothetical protein
MLKTVKSPFIRRARYSVLLNLRATSRQRLSGGGFLLRLFAIVWFRFSLTLLDIRWRARSLASSSREAILGLCWGSWSPWALDFVRVFDDAPEPYLTRREVIYCNRSPYSACQAASSAGVAFSRSFHSWDPSLRDSVPSGFSARHKSPIAVNSLRAVMYSFSFFGILNLQPAPAENLPARFGSVLPGKPSKYTSCRVVARG